MPKFKVFRKIEIEQYVILDVPNVRSEGDMGGHRAKCFIEAAVSAGQLIDWSFSDPAKAEVGPFSRLEYEEVGE